MWILHKVRRLQQSTQFQDGHQQLVSPIQYLTKLEIWSQSPLLLLSYGIEQLPEKNTLMSQ